MLPSVEYLGHTISAQGFHASKSKVSGVVDAPKPKDVTELRSFIGLVNYYAKFLPDLATTLAPLYSLLQRKSRWAWGRAQEQVFSPVKELLLSELLVHFDSSLPLILACDTLSYEVGAVLSHRFTDVPNSG